MRVLLTIHPADDVTISALRHVLEAANLRLEGEFERVEDRIVYVRIVADHPSEVSRLCAHLLNERLVENVSAKRLDI